MNKLQILLIISLFIVFLVFTGTTVSYAQPAGVGVVSGELRQWHRVTITFDGPLTSENDVPNPFTDYRLNVTFTNGGRSVTVPGFYAADGDAANTSATDGDKWRVHFTPDRIGTWTYTASFRTGPDIAVSLDTTAGTPDSFDGASGNFVVTASDKGGIDLRSKGFLRYVGGHHFQFAGNGEYFLKGGADSPENFLAYFEFDGTSDTGGLNPPGSNFLHEYAPHAGDWNPGDPAWQGNLGMNIIGALNYLSSQGMNSVYIMTYTIDGGDGGDTWPWTSNTVRDRFDVSKLAQWEIVFSHMDEVGLQLHLVTQEIENDNALGGLTLERQLYYRELVARFGHHLALIWNIGEENSNTDAERIAFAEYFRALDPYEHPITVHSRINGADTFYDGLLGSEFFEGASIQGFGLLYNDWAMSLRERTELAGRSWAIFGDEQGPPVAADMSNLDQLRRESLWGNLMGGGAGVEWYFGYQGVDFGDVQSEDWRVAEPLWQMTDIALDFYQNNLPFWEMTPDNTFPRWSQATPMPAPLGFYKANNTYLVFLPETSGVVDAEVDLGGATGVFNVTWFNPRTGQSFSGGTLTPAVGGGWQSLGFPPGEVGQDWAVLIALAGPPVASAGVQNESSDGAPPPEAVYIIKRVNNQINAIASVGSELRLEITYFNPTDAPYEDAEVSTDIDTRLTYLGLISSSDDISRVRFSRNKLIATGINLAPGEEGRIVLLVRVNSGARPGDVLSGFACLSFNPKIDSNIVTINILPEVLPVTGDSPYGKLRVPVTIAGGLLFAYTGVRVVRTYRRRRSEGSI